MTSIETCYNKIKDGINTSFNDMHIMAMRQMIMFFDMLYCKEPNVKLMSGTLTLMLHDKEAEITCKERVAEGGMILECLFRNDENE